MWKHLYMKQSSSHIGTLYQLKTLINRTGVPLDPSDNVKSAEDFLFVSFFPTLWQLQRLLFCPMIIM